MASYDTATVYIFAEILYAVSKIIFVTHRFRVSLSKCAKFIKCDRRTRFHLLFWEVGEVMSVLTQPHTRFSPFISQLPPCNAFDYVVLSLIMILNSYWAEFNWYLQQVLQYISVQCCNIVQYYYRLV